MSLKGIVRFLQIVKLVAVLGLVVSLTAHSPTLAAPNPGDSGAQSLAASVAYPQVSREYSAGVGSNPLALPSTVVNPALIHVPSDVSDLQSAINQVSDGGIIEIAAGTYASPTNGWMLNDVPKGFTIRAAAGATVALDGGGARNIFQSINSSLANSRPIAFQNLIFQNGYSATDGLSGGVTLYNTRATFIGVTFQKNFANTPSTGGGAIFVAINSTAFFFNTQWINNGAKNFGAGLALESQSKAYIYNSQFINNRTNNPYHLPVSSGGAIHVGNSTLRVANTRFDSNQAGYVGGAIYSIGDWVDPVTTPQTDVKVTNSTFINNQAIPDPSVSVSYPTEGGAFHAEGQTTAAIFNSRFITNRAMIGGGVNDYRAIMTIDRSVFQGNQATGTGAGNGFGGAISISSNDTWADGSTNRRTASLTLTNSLIQGRYGNVGTVAQSGGGLAAGGDDNRMYGQNSVSQMGTVTDNRAVATINNVAFFDLDVQGVNGVPGTGVGAAISTGLANLTIQNSIIANCDALGSSNGSGGGMALMDQTLANITNTLIGHNTAGLYGGGLFVQGSTINLSDSKLVQNEVSPGVSESILNSYGAAIFATPDDGRRLPVNGNISNNIISNNIGLAIYDDDRTNGPINDVRYNGNQIYSTSFGSTVYADTVPGYYGESVSQLNSLVIVRNNGTQTAKSQTDNIAPTSAPVTGMILAVPPTILSTNASGDAAPPTSAYVVYAWSGGSATLNGVSVSNYAGITAPITTVGPLTLSVNGTPFTASITQGTTPGVSTQASPRTISQGTSSVLSWSITGTFLDVAIDQGVTINPAPSGSVQVAPTTTKTYDTFAVTQEGGSLISTTVTVGNGVTYNLSLPLIIR